MLGPGNGLGVYVSSYEPTVDCDSHPSRSPPSERSCGKVLTKLPAGTARRPFRSEIGPREHNDVTLPRNFAGEWVLPVHFPPLLARPWVITHKRLLDWTDPDSCEIHVSIPPTWPSLSRARWVDLWEAGIALNTMCIQHGMTGTAYQLGESLGAVNWESHPYVHGWLTLK